MGELKKRDKIIIGCVIFFFFGVAAWNIYFGVKGMFLTREHSMDDVFQYAIREDAYEGTIGCVSNKRLDYYHRINHKWAGEEYYYIILSQEMDKAVVVRAPKNWLKNAGSDTYNQVSLEARGIVRDFRYDVKKKLSTTFSSLQAEGIQVNQTVFLDLLADRICMVRLFVGISVLIIVLYFYVAAKKFARYDAKPLSKPLFILMIFLLILTFAAFLYLRNKT